MKLFFIIIYSGFIVSARKRNKYDYSSYEYTSVESDEHVPFADGFFDLTGSVRREFALEAAMVDHGRNMICSPLSVLMPLGKLALGARKRSERELLDALGLTSSKQLKAAFSQLISNMEYLPGVSLDVASRLYVSTEKNINGRFMKRTKELFKSSCQRIRPSNPKQTAETINDWVAEMTRNKIKKLIHPSDISESTSLILVNAVYFSGNWLHKFKRTYTDNFHSPSGTRRLPMMTQQGQFSYWKCDTLNAEVIEIPYEGSQSSMIIVLPYNNNGLPGLLRALKLAPELLNEALEKMKTADIILSMPKFKIETELDLKPLFRKIGLKSILDPRYSNLSGIIDGETVYVTKAKHKAVIEVNEKGTEAAAATGIIIQKMSAYISPEIKVNRLFLFYIKVYQEQLFSGVFYGNT